jgi:hypothetical protein
MRNVRILLAALFVAAVGFGATIADDKKADPKYTIKEVMKMAHGGEAKSLRAKVASGKASQEEKDKLVDLYSALAAAKPNKGDVAVWKEKTEPIVVAAKAIAADKDTSKATADLIKTTDCKACHSVFK